MALVTLLAHTTYTTLQKATSQYNKETKDFSAAKQKNLIAQVIEEDDFRHESASLLDNNSDDEDEEKRGSADDSKSPKHTKPLKSPSTASSHQRLLNEGSNKSNNSNSGSSSATIDPSANELPLADDESSLLGRDRTPAATGSGSADAVVDDSGIAYEEEGHSHSKSRSGTLVDGEGGELASSSDYMTPTMITERRRQEELKKLLEEVIMRLCSSLSILSFI